MVSERKPVGKKKQPRKQPKQPPYRRGRICGILPLSFVADLVGMSFWSTHSLFYAWLKRNKLKDRELTMVQLKEFMEFVDQSQRGDSTGDVDDHIYL